MLNVFTFGNLLEIKCFFFFFSNFFVVNVFPFGNFQSSGICLYLIAVSVSSDKCLYIWEFSGRWKFIFAVSLSTLFMDSQADLPYSTSIIQGDIDLDSQLLGISQNNPMSSSVVRKQNGVLTSM